MRALLVFLLLFLATNSALAMRCGRDLVLEGDHKIQVLEACGEPVFRERRVEHLPVLVHHHGHYYHDYRPVVVEEWVYNLGPRRFMRRLWFHDGEVVRIDTLDYGY